jgi:hypothetical protein
LYLNISLEEADSGATNALGGDFLDEEADLLGDLATKALGGDFLDEEADLLEDLTTFGADFFEDAEEEAFPEDGFFLGRDAGLTTFGFRGKGFLLTTAFLTGEGFLLGTAFLLGEVLFAGEDFFATIAAFALV